MLVEWTPRAIRQRRNILTFIAHENPEAAKALNEEIVKGVDRISCFPESGRPGRISGTREVVFHKNYFFAYKVGTNHITILAVLHTSRQWPPNE